MPADLLAEIKGASLAELRVLWTRTLGEPLPTCGNRQLLRLLLAWRVQAAPDVRTANKALRRLEQLVERRDDRSTSRDRLTPSMTRGTELIRDWKGTKHRILVVAGGYIYEGDRYSSLSVIARKITGTRWSGPRFFGLKGGKDP